jgi:flagellar biosynthesis/type III secretory pathway chaperone
MNRLDSAAADFSAALDQLERTLAQNAQLLADVRDAQRQIQELRKDKVRLSAEIERLTLDRRRLEGLNTHVAGRLDSAIRDIRAVLQPEGV